MPGCTIRYIDNLPILFTAFLVALAAFGRVDADSLTQIDTLPRFEIEIDTAYLAALEKNPYGEEEYPALFHVDTITYECDVRYRGATSRNLPKKSYRVEFPDDENIFGVEKLNFNAEYRDISLIRNHLAMKLFTFCGLPASETHHIRLAINGEYLGVYLQVENVDEYFFERHDRPLSVYYKAKNLGALMAPLMFYEDYPRTWEKKHGNANDFSDISTLFNKLYHWSSESFSDSVETLFDIDAVLSYFAIQFALSNEDGFCKNQFLYFHPQRRLWELVPWDMDATFGNDFNGDYTNELVTARAFDPLAHHLFFQRCIEYPELEKKFFSTLNNVLSTGFDSLRHEVDRVYGAIREAVYLDSTKRGHNEAFDDEMERIKTFLNERREALDSLGTFARFRLSEPVLAAPTVTDGDVAVSVSIRSESAQEVRFIYSTDVDFVKRAGGANFRRLQLYDDGQHEDGEAGDLVYGNTLRFTKYPPPVVPCAFEGEHGTWSPNGLFNIDYVPTRSLVITFQDSGKAAIPTDSALSFSGVYAVNGKQVLTIVNTSTLSANVSCLQIVATSHPNIHYMLPPLSFLDSGAVLALGPDSLLIARHFSTCIMRTDFSLSLTTGDTLRLLTLCGEMVDEMVIDTISGIAMDSFTVVINEINYNPASTHDTEDWVELHNPCDTAVVMDGWHFYDSEDNHCFTFPESTIIASGGYLVLCRDTSHFRGIYPEVRSIIGNMGFGLNGDGEKIRLYDYADNCIDSLTYADRGDWPLEPDGTGPTLELIAPDLDNTDPDSWKASRFIGGSPGKENSMPVAVHTDIMDVPVRQLGVRSDRYRLNLLIDYTHTKAEHIVMRIVGLDGRVLHTFSRGMLRKGTHTFRVPVARIGTGTRLLQLYVDGRQRNVRKLVVVR